MKILVTGGGGFLGKALVRALVARGEAVRSFSRGSYPELDTLGVECVQGDLQDYAAVRQAVVGCEAVFHVAAKAGVWGAYQEYYAANVTGTENILRACQELGIRYLVYTSSPSVVFDGADQDGVDESAPYPKDFLAHYPKTKAIAERLVIAANSAKLATVSLRPHLIWGPGDNHLVPRILQLGAKGRIRFIGAPGKKVDTVYIDNAVEAHLLAFDRLLHEPAKVAGKSYFVTNQEPWANEDIVNGFLAAGGLPQVTKRVSTRFAYTAGAVLETAFKLLGRQDDPPMTRFVARQLSTAHWYNPKAVREDLGYHPKVSMREGLRRLEAFYRGK
jgi:nucleoside-diphosphate-sugar epimerase